MTHLLSVRLYGRRVSTPLKASGPEAIPARFSDQGPYQLGNQGKKRETRKKYTETQT